MAKPQEKLKAIKMRRNGSSIKDIAKILKVSTATSSKWCREITLSDSQKEKLMDKQNEYSKICFQKNNQELHNKKLKSIEVLGNEGKNMVGSISKRDLLILGLGIYWAEGYKKGNDEFGFTNSDHFMIKKFIEWLDVILSVSTERLILRVSINEMHRDRENEVVAFWSRFLNIPISQFTKTSFIKTATKKVYENSDNYQGTLRVKIRKGTELRRIVLGAIDQLRDFSHK